MKTRRIKYFIARTIGKSLFLLILFVWFSFRLGVIYLFLCLFATYASSASMCQFFKQTTDQNSVETATQFVTYSACVNMSLFVQFRFSVNVQLKKEGYLLVSQLALQQDGLMESILTCYILCNTKLPIPYYCIIHGHHVLFADKTLSPFCWVKH